tara:strand:- start:595 stop:726 length:132 start_codon:yes stop_codon:yes gene_type:complete
MNDKTIVVTVKGVKHYFEEDDLTSAKQKAAEFLLKLDEEGREF